MISLAQVLDPAQNHSFKDNYVALPFDLSQVALQAASCDNEHDIFFIYIYSFFFLEEGGGMG